MKRILIAVALICSGCTVPQGPVAGPPSGSGPVATRSSSAATASFGRSVSRIEPVAESMCRQRNPGQNRGCDFVFSVSNDPKLGANAFQTIGSDGRPRVTFTTALLRQMQNDDEVAFVLAHEVSHQIEQHLARVSAQQRLGAVLLGGLVASTGRVSASVAADFSNLGAFLGRRAYSKNFEFEADRLAVSITARAGYDPIKGAQPFARMETGSSGFLSTHPASSQRLRAIEQRAREIGA